MTDGRDEAPDQRSRARLEAIVYGRGEAITDAERDAARAELARLVEQRAANRSAGADDPVDAVIESEAPDAVPEEARDDHPKGFARAGWPLPHSRRRRRVAVMAIAAILAVALAGVAVRVLAFGWQPFGPTDSMAVFDRPQTERDLQFPGDPDAQNLDVDTLRFVGSEPGFDVYVVMAERPALSPVQKAMVCMIVVQTSAASTGGGCTPPDEFSQRGGSLGFTEDGVSVEVRWDIVAGLRVTRETHEPLEPALSVFSDAQDEADLNAVVFLPDLPTALQDSVRYLGQSGEYFAAAYRDAENGICLAVYDGRTSVATSESACVPEDEFERSGVELQYPADAPEVSVKWGPGQGLTVSGR